MVTDMHMRQVLQLIDQTKHLIIEVGRKGSRRVRCVPEAGFSH
jgi:hypothetical protein